MINKQMNVQDKKTLEFICRHLGRTVDPKETDADCDCGGKIFQYDSAFGLCDLITQQYGLIPRHKKTRIQKKWRKRWFEKCSLSFWILPMMGLQYRCGACGKRFSMWQLMSRCITVEPLDN